MNCNACLDKGVSVVMMNNRDKLVCPRCFASEKKENIKTAQFGGTTGGQPSSWAPGASPFASGAGSAKNRGINDFTADVPMDGIISRTHNPAPIDEHRNMEKRLEVYHKHQNEDDMIPYWLTPEEREKLRIKKELRRRHKNNQMSQEQVDKNSVPYIKKHFAPSPEHLTTLEQQLIGLHKYKPNTKMKWEDELPPIIQPERIHTSQVVNHGRTSPFMNLRDDEEENAAPNFDNLKMEYPIGTQGIKTLTKGSELDQYLDGAFRANWGGAEGPREKTLLDYPAADQIGPHSVGHGSDNEQSSPISDADLNEFMSTEKRLEQVKKNKPQGSPKDPYSYWSAYEKAKGTQTPGEPLGVTDTYHGGSFNPSPIPRY